MRTKTVTPDAFADHLHALRLKRRELKALTRATKPRRKSLSAATRREVFESTGGRCHICGGLIKGKWEADHIQPHSGGGTHARSKYLPAHKGCNNYRWDYSPEEFNLILKLGVWTRTLIERKKPQGLDLARAFLTHEQKRELRRKQTGR